MSDIRKRELWTKETMFNTASGVKSGEFLVHFRIKNWWKVLTFESWIPSVTTMK